MEYKTSGRSFVKWGEDLSYRPFGKREENHGEVKGEFYYRAGDMKKPG